MLLLVALTSSGRAAACAARSALPDPAGADTLRAMTEPVHEVVEGDGYAVANVDALAEVPASGRCAASSA